MKAPVLLLLLVSTAFGQSAKKTKIKYSCACDDAVGMRYGTAFRDLLARSPRFEEAALEADPILGSKLLSHNISVSTVSMDGANDEGKSAFVSTVLTLDGELFGHYIQHCGSSKIDSCVADMMAYLDSRLNPPTK